MDDELTLCCALDSIGLIVRGVSGGGTEDSKALREKAMVYIKKVLAMLRKIM
jgi:hypothetical protein